MTFKKGNIPWNKGLTKETDHRVYKNSEAKKGQIPWNKGKPLSEETRQRISETLKRKYGSGDIVHPMKGKKHTEKSRRNMSENHYDISGENHPMYGKHLSEETRQKMSLAQSGEKNHRWLGGKSFEPYGLEFNDELKEQIRERNNHQCQLCRRDQEEFSRLLSVHHIDYNKQNNDPQNLVSLCDFCHIKTNFDRDYWEIYFNGALTPAMT